MDFNLSSTNCIRLPLFSVYDFFLKLRKVGYWENCDEIGVVWLIFRIIRMKQYLFVGFESPQRLALARSDWRCKYTQTPLTLSLFVGFRLNRGSNGSRAFCGLHPALWIMQTRCNWSPNRNGLLFTFLRSTIRSFALARKLFDIAYEPGMCSPPLLRWRDTSPPS